MAIAAWVAGAFGAYDRETVERLPSEEGRRILLVGCSCLLPCGTAAVGVGYAADLVAGASSSNLIVAGLAGSIAVLAVGSLLRITMAGSGIAPQVSPENAARWRPKLWPAVYLACFGAVLAQPLVALVLSPRLDGELSEMRDQIVTMHEQALHRSAVEQQAELASEVGNVTARLSKAEGRLARERVELASIPDAVQAAGNDAGAARVMMARAVLDDGAEVAALTKDLRSAADELSAVEHAAIAAPGEVLAYRANLEQCAFLADRIRFAWRQPVVPLVVTVLTALLTGLPLILRQRFLGAYARAQHAAQRIAVTNHFLRVDAAVDDVLGRHPTYGGRPRARFADRPFNTEPLDFFGARLGVPSPPAAVDAAIDELLATLPAE